VLPGIQPITEVKSNSVDEINRTIKQINHTITAINVMYGNLNHSNIQAMNYIPLMADYLTPMTNVTPVAGWLQAKTVSALKELLLYDGSNWQELARHDFVYNVFSSLALGNYSHSHGGATGSGTTGSYGSGSSNPVPHTHSVPGLTITGDTHTHTVNYNNGL
jgi:hypothetical protein